MKRCFAFLPFSLLACSSPTAPAAKADGGPTELACPVTTAGPTVHGEKISADETWTAAASPHVVTVETVVDEGVTLVIEPCAKVLFAKDAALTLRRKGARLVAEGTEKRPISFAGKEGARWGALTIAHPATASLRHVQLDGGGGDKFHGYGSLVLQGHQQTPAAAPALLDHVTIAGSLGPGVIAEYAAAFAAGSTALVVRDSGSAEVPWPVVIGEHALDSLPSGAYTGNRVDEILVKPEGANGYASLQEDATIHARGVPYRVGRFATEALVVGHPERRTVLTIEPGVTMKFHPGARFTVGAAIGDGPAMGVLHAVGTAAAPIVLTSAAASPAAGDWTGLWFSGVPDPDNRVAHARIEFTGADCSCHLNTCTETATHDAAVHFLQAPASAFITDTTIAHAKGHGIFRGWVGESAPDFTATNVFDDVLGCVQTLPAPLKGGCTAKPTCP